jgi:hypothetical protein
LKGSGWGLEMKFSLEKVQNQKMIKGLTLKLIF